MIYLVFDSEQSAIAADAMIGNNVRAWVLQNAPNALSDDGERLRGRNAATGELVDVFTERWAVPRQRQDGRWVFQKPTQDKTAPVPVQVFLSGINTEELEYDPAWFSQSLYG